MNVSSIKAPVDYLSSLPDELAVSIFKLLPFHDWACCRLISKKFSTLLRDRVFKEYKSRHNAIHQLIKGKYTDTAARFHLAQNKNIISYGSDIIRINPSNKVSFENNNFPVLLPSGALKELTFLSKPQAIDIHLEHLVVLVDRRLHFYNLHTLQPTSTLCKRPYECINATSTALYAKTNSRTYRLDFFHAEAKVHLADRPAISILIAKVKQVALSTLLLIVSIVKSLLITAAIFITGATIIMLPITIFLLATSLIYGTFAATLPIVGNFVLTGIIHTAIIIAIIGTLTGLIKGIHEIRRQR